MSSTTVVLCSLLNQIRQAHEQKRPDALPRLVPEFIAVAARRFSELARRLIRKCAPDMVGETDAVVSEAYKRLNDSLAKYLPPAHPQEYFHCASLQIRHALQDLIRKKQVERERSDGSVPSDVVASSGGPDKKMGRIQFWERFFFVVERMPTELRTYLDLHWTQGFTHLECAGHIGITEKQAKSRWMDVKLWLRDQLGEFPQDI